MLLHIALTRLGGIRLSGHIRLDVGRFKTAEGSSNRQQGGLRLCHDIAVCCLGVEHLYSLFGNLDSLPLLEAE